MNSLWLFSLPLCLLLLLLAPLRAAEERREIYVVYMGAIPGDSNARTLKETHLQLLSSVLKRSSQVDFNVIARHL